MPEYGQLPDDVGTDKLLYPGALLIEAHILDKGVPL
jgi:hypothetical protein